MSTPDPGSSSAPPTPSTSPPAAPVSAGTSTAVWIVAIIVVAAALGGVGFFAGYEYRGSPASSSSTVNNTLSIFGAGTLQNLFEPMSGTFASENPGISAPLAAQMYEGSLDITSGITAGTIVTDVAALADYRLAPQLLYPKYADYEVVWGQTTEALVWNPASVTGFAGINDANWASKLINTINNGSKPLGVWNASTDPNGYNEIFSMMLQGMLYDGGNISSVYSYFYSGAPGALAVPNGPSRAILGHESQAAADLSSGVMSAVITYESYAILNNLTYLPLNPIVGLYANNTTALSDYSMLSTSVIGSSGALVKVVPAPILFTTFVPLNAPNPSLGAAFINFLLSAQGKALVAKAFTPISPAWCDKISSAPSILQPNLVPLPAWAQTILG